MRVLFMGTPEFALPPLEAILAAGHDVVLVVTRPDAPRGRGRAVAAPAVKEAALRAGLPVFQPGSANADPSLQRVRSARADIGVVVAYGEILGPALLSVPPHGFLNLHASLLPKYRGAAPIHWALIRGEQETGVTMQRVVPALDAGPVLAQRAVSIGRDETAGDLHDRLCRAGAALLAGVLDAIGRGEQPPERAQNEADASYAPKLQKRHRRIDWGMPAEDIRNLVRGLAPWPGATTRFIGSVRTEQVTVLKTDVLPQAALIGPRGTVLQVGENEGMVVQSGRGAAIIERLKPASGRAMSAADFIHGRHVQVGDRFA